MLKRLCAVSLALALCLASGQSRAKDALELSAHDIAGIWRNINEIVLVLSANIALDDEWIEDLRGLQPATGKDINQELSAFRDKLNVLLADSALDAAPDLAAHSQDRHSPLYMASGQLLDHLVYYLIASDSLASVAIYYGGDDAPASQDQDIVAQINLANQRLDAFIEENGL